MSISSMGYLRPSSQIEIEYLQVQYGKNYFAYLTLSS